MLSRPWCLFLSLLWFANLCLKGEAGCSELVKPSSRVSTQAAPVITAPLFVTSAQAGYRASVPPQPGCTYAWTLSGGFLASPATGSTVFFTAGVSGRAVLTCTATNPAGGVSDPGTFHSSIVPAPLIVAFQGEPSILTCGQKSRLSWRVSGITWLSLDQGIGEVTELDGCLVTPFTTTRYTLTGSNCADTEVVATLTVTVVPEPRITAFSAEPETIEVGGRSRLAFWFSEGTGVLDPGFGVVASGEPKYVTPTTTTTYTLTVTNAAGDSQSQSETVTVLLKPKIAPDKPGKNPALQ